MLKRWTMLTCILLCSMELAQAAPLDSPDIVYIDGLPCNSACQSYMAWYRQVTVSRQRAPVSAQPPPSQLAKPSPKAKAQRTTKTRENRPHSAPPARVAKKAAPKPIEVPSPKIVDLRHADGGEAKSAPPEKITASPPIPNPTSGSDAGTTSEQVASAPAAEDLTTATAGPAPEQNAENNTKPSGTAEPTAPADTETTALAAPNIADQLVAVLLVRAEIESVSDLANKIVAIDILRSDSVASVRTAIVAAGAAEVQMSEGETLAFDRVIDGEVPAAVVTIASPEAAKMWNSSLPGFKILRIPLSPPSETARRG